MLSLLPRLKASSVKTLAAFSASCRPAIVSWPHVRSCKVTLQKQTCGQQPAHFDVLDEVDSVLVADHVPKAISGHNQGLVLGAQELFVKVWGCHHIPASMGRCELQVLPFLPGRHSAAAAAAAMTGQYSATQARGQKQLPAPLCSRCILWHISLADTSMCCLRTCLQEPSACSHAARLAAGCEGDCRGTRTHFFRRRSPKARDTASTPPTRQVPAQTTTPPASSMRARSSVRFGLWSSDSGTAAQSCPLSACFLCRAQLQACTQRLAQHAEGMLWACRCLCSRLEYP